MQIHQWTLLGGGPVKFNASGGNVYGEIDVRIEDDQVIDPPVVPPPPTPTAGINLGYVYGESPTASSPITIAYTGSLPTGKTASPGAISFTAQGTVIPTSGDNESLAAPAKESGLQPGLWTVSASQIIGNKPTATRTCKGIS